MQPLLDPDRVPLPAFGLSEDLDRLRSDWHAHGRPQLLYCVEGAMRLRTAARQAVLPPERAAWIPAGLPHQVETGRPVRLRTVYFSPSPADGDDLQIFAAPPLLRELARQAAAWGPAPPPDLPVDAFFIAFRGLLDGWRAEGAIAGLPSAQSPGLQAALDLLLQGLDRPVGLPDAARVGGLSARTLQRRCQQELGMPLQTWLLRARMLRALELLANDSLSVGEVALACGYDTQSAFIRTFHREFGSPPGAWRRAEG